MTGICAHSARSSHTAVWTGTEMIIWGGTLPVAPNPILRGDGARYDPLFDLWRPMSTVNADLGAQS